MKSRGQYCRARADIQFILKNREELRKGSREGRGGRGGKGRPRTGDDERRCFAGCGPQPPKGGAATKLRGARRGEEVGKWREMFNDE